MAAEEVSGNEATSEPATIVERCVCAGWRIWTRDGKKTQVWLRLDDNGDAATDKFGAHAFLKPLVKYTQPGMVYELTFLVDDNGKTTTCCGGEKRPRYIGLYPNENYRAELRLASDAVEAQVRAEAIRKKDAEDNAMASRLQPIRDRYRDALPNERRAILATVIEFITR